LTVLRSGSASDVGRVRIVNEDLAFEAGSLYGVADGMGGHVGGDIAARIAVDSLEEAFNRDPSVEGMLVAVQQANVAVWERGRVDPDLRGMGTTLTAAALIADSAADSGDRLILVNVGDSRAYRLREGVLEQLTTDHSVAEELVARGELTPEEANLHPHRHILTRVLGVTPEVEVDAWELFPMAGDRYLICSDGLSNEVPSSQITSILGKDTSPVLVAEELIQTANNRGGHDNITVVVLEVIEATIDEGTTPGAGATTDHSSEEQAAPVPLTPSAMHTPGPRRGVGTLALERPRTVGTDVTGFDGTFRTEGGRAGGYGLDADRVRAGAGTGRKQRVITFRLVVFFVAVIVVLGGAWGLVRWYLDESYFVSLDGKQIVIEQGRPGGFLWFQPTVVDRTGVTTSEVPQNQLSGVQNGTFTASSTAGARALVRRMVLTECNYDEGVPGVTPTTAPSSKTPSIALCPNSPTAKVSTPPTTTPTTTASTLPTGSSTTSSSSTTTSTTTGGTG
jgi:PPM family protein phosphatase